MGLGRESASHWVGETGMCRSVTHLWLLPATSLAGKPLSSAQLNNNNLGRHRACRCPLDVGPEHVLTMHRHHRKLS